MTFGKNSKIYIAGHRGLVGSAILRKLQSEGYTDLIYRTHKQLDLTNQHAVAEFFHQEKPEYVILAAARVGGIVANNTYRADFIYENLAIQNNVIHQSYVNGVKKLLFLGSTCIYPKNAPQPMSEDSLLTSPLEYTNEPYAVAKIAGIKMCESYNIQYGTNFVSVMPTNLYGPNDNFDLEKSHVIPALIRKIHLAKLLNEGNIEKLLENLNLYSFNQAQIYLEQFGIYKDSVEVWGSGNPRREFLYSEDLADACIFVLKNINFKYLVQNKKDVRNTHINIGTGVDISIKELAELIQKIVGFKGKLYFNKSKPDGTMIKLTDPSKLYDLGWKYKVQLEYGILKVYEWYLSSK